MAAPTYIISRVADPVFALFIGLSAAATRINREEKDKGRSTFETINAGLRYARLILMHVLRTRGALWKSTYANYHILTFI
jgi:hypothetical protein